MSSALVVGAGAVGCAVAGIIDDHLPGAARILASGERLRRYRDEGFVVNGTKRRFPLEGPDAKEPADLVIVCVKTMHLAQAIEDVRPRVGPSTLIVSLLNGITSEEELSAAFGAEKVPLAMVLGIDAVREGSSVRYASAGKIHFGDARNAPGAWSPRVQRIAAFFERAGISFVVPEDMVRTLWFKFMINVGINQASAVLRAPYGVFQQVPAAQRVMESAMAEVVAVSKALGTGLRDDDIPAWYKTLRGLDPTGLTSMLQDVLAGRATEVDAFAGAVIERGRAAGIPTPVNVVLYDLLSALAPQPGSSTA